MYREEIAAINKRLLTENLSLEEFELLCRKRSELSIKQEMARPKQYTKQKREVQLTRFSYPKTATLGR